MTFSSLQSLFALGISALAVAQSTQPVIRGGNVSWVGVTNATTKTDSFRGIPFAQPPTGSLRFKPPVAWRAPSNSTTVNATNFGPSCPQGNARDLPELISEDCLTLNIWKPSNVTGKLPVLVWIYGGGFYFGTALGYPGDGIVNASIVFKKPVIYVAANYRTGIFGFPPGSDAANARALNLGLKDQRLALEWVQKNIGYFGGDPTKVTLFGQSAGAISTTFQAMYNGGNFGQVFRGMILESGSPSSLNVPPANDPVLESAYKFVVNATGCTNSPNKFECVRTAPSDVLQRANQDVLRDPIVAAVPDQGPVVIGPVLAPGDVFLPEPASTSVHAGRFAKLPFISGSTLDEGTVFVDGQQLKTEQDIVDWLTHKTPGLYFGITNVSAVRELLRYYPADPAAGSPYNTGNETFGQAAQYKRLVSIIGDLFFQASKRDFLRTATKVGVKSWSYLLTSVVPRPGNERYGVYHSADLELLLQVVPVSSDVPPEYITLQETLIDYWLSFAYHLNPNQGSFTSRPYWPVYGSNTTTLQFGTNSSIISDTFRKEAIEFIINSPSVYN